jgi:putative exosortase-associated protein (TIGR04073 family)
MVMRKTVLLIAVVAFLACIVSPVSFAEDQGANDPGDALRKLGRGLANCATFPIEVPNQISKTNNIDGPIAAVTYGLVKGIVMGTFRAVVGVYEVATFPIPLPEYYKPILTDPEFMLESWTS